MDWCLSLSLVQPLFWAWYYRQIWACQLLQSILFWPKYISCDRGPTYILSNMGFLVCIWANSLIQGGLWGHCHLGPKNKKSNCWYGFTPGNSGARFGPKIKSHWCSQYFDIFRCFYSLIKVYIRLESHNLLIMPSSDFLPLKWQNKLLSLLHVYLANYWEFKITTNESSICVKKIEPLKQRLFR